MILATVIVWLVGMLVGLGYTLRAAHVAWLRLQDADSDALRRLQKGRNLRAESFRAGTLFLFAVAGLITLFNLNGWLPPDWAMPLRGAVPLLLLAGGYGVVANSILDARHQARLEDAAEAEAVRKARQP